MAKGKIKFPFKPNERVIAAFRQERNRKAAVKLITQALLEIAAEVIEPYEVLMEEHPEFREYRWTALRYSHLAQEIDIKSDK